MTESLHRPGVDFPGVALTFLCHDGHGHFLMAKRGSQARDEQNRWDIGGGMLEIHEDLLESLAREISEEYGVTIKESHFLGYRDVHREHNGQKTHWIALDFLVKIQDGTPQIQELEKFSDIGYFTLDKLPTPLHSQLPYYFEQHAPLLKRLLANL